MASTATDNVGALKATAINGVKMYAVGAHKWTPEWLAAQTKKASRALRKDAQYQRRIELIQDLTMPTSTGRLAFTADGEHLLVTGTYPPQIRLYELRQLSLKFQRNLVADIADARVLSDDYSKIALLCSDRSVCLHARYGSHYSLRIPRAGRALEYDRASCDLLCAASAPEIYRINLEHGRFLAPLAAQSPAVNALAWSAVHGLLAAAGADGALECFDLRQRRAVGRIQCADDESVELSAVRFDDSGTGGGGGGGLRLAVGTGDGRVMIYDLRSSQPLCVKDHMYGSAVARIAWHRSVAGPRPRVVSADHRAVRVWDPDSGDALASIEAPGGAKINDVCVFRDSGLLLMALESSQIPCYFLPALGPAPKWCGYLENLTEELEETAQVAIYDDYKFVTREELESLNSSNLIGTNLLRAYMHGFFIDYRLYQKAKTLADPFAYEAYRQKRIQEKLESERAARITMKRRLPKVNRDLAARLLKEQEEEQQVDEDDMANKKKKKKNKSGSDLLKDERFRALFSDEAFRVDENSKEYQALHPNQSKKQGSSLIEEHFHAVDDGESDDDDEDEAMSSGESLFSEEGEDDEEEEPSQKKNNKQAKTKDSKEIERKPKMYVIKDERHAKAFENNMSLADEENLPLEKRIGLEEKRSEEAVSCARGQGGSREISFHSKSVPEGSSGNSFNQKRGIQSLNLKPDRYDFRGRGGRGRGSRGRDAGKRRSFKRH